MKKLFLSAVLLLTWCGLHAQVTAEDAKGETSIIYRGSSLGLGITDANLSANWNNLQTLDIQKKFRTIWGLSTSAKNQDGLGELLKSGKFNPESRISGFIGIRWLDDDVRFELFEKRDQDSEFMDHYMRALKLTPGIDSVINASPLSRSNKLALTKELEPVYKTKDINQAIIELNKISVGTDLQAGYTKVSAFLTKRQQYISKYAQRYADATKNFDQYDAYLATHLTETVHRAYTLYLNGGLSATKFNLYDPAATTTLVGRMDTVKFRGGFLDVGFNYDLGARWTLGFSAGYERANNLDSLVLKDYAIKTSEKLGSEEISSAQNYKAYPGGYFDYNRANIRFDVIYYAKINDDHRLVWNMLYGRMTMPLEESRIRSVVNIGTAISAFKKGEKFAGGLYLQSNDTFNNTRTGDVFLKRITFGLVAKYSFNSLLDRAFK